MQKNTGSDAGAPKCVQFSGEDEKEIIAIFASAQDTSAYPHQGEVKESDQRYVIFLSKTELFLS
ncbi:hypothetical protein ACWXWL_11210 [Pantoea ananatis]